MEPSELASALLAQATSFASHSTTQTQTRGGITTQQQPHETAHARFASYITTTTTLQPSFTAHDPIIRVTLHNANANPRRHHDSSRYTIRIIRVTFHSAITNPRTHHDTTTASRNGTP